MKHIDHLNIILFLNAVPHRPATDDGTISGSNLTFKRLTLILLTRNMFASRHYANNVFIFIVIGFKWFGLVPADAPHIVVNITVSTMSHAHPCVFMLIIMCIQYIVPIVLNIFNIDS